MTPNTVPVDQVQPLVVEGTLLAGSSYPWTHAVRARVEDGELLMFGVQPTLCADYRTRDGNVLAKHRRRPPRANVSLNYATEAAADSPIRTVTLWADAVAAAADSRRDLCPQCLKVAEHGGDGWPARDRDAVAAAAARELVSAGGNGIGGALAGQTLNARQQSALTRLVTNDFASLEASLRLQAEDHWAARRAEITERWEAKRVTVPDVTARLTEDLARLRSDWDAITRRLESDGYAVTLANAPLPTVSKLSLPGLDKELQDAKREVDDALRRALRLLETRRLAALRSILLVVIGEQLTNDVVSAIPRAEDVFAQAMRDQPA